MIMYEGPIFNDKVIKTFVPLGRSFINTLDQYVKINIDIYIVPISYKLDSNTTETRNPAQVFLGLVLLGVLVETTLSMQFASRDFRPCWLFCICLVSEESRRCRGKGREGGLYCKSGCL